MPDWFATASAHQAMRWLWMCVGLSSAVLRFGVALDGYLALLLAKKASACLSRPSLVLHSFLRLLWTGPLGSRGSSGAFALAFEQLHV